MRIVKKILKIIGWILILILIGLYTAFYYYTSPKSDRKALKKFDTVPTKPEISLENFKGFEYRKLTIQRDTTLPTLVFVHGTIGSSLDFSRYMKDSSLLSKANMISYDRIGYNYKDKNPVQESIAFEAEMLEDLIKNLDKDKVILVGYSYGGPIALAVKDRCKKIILLAPAAYSKVEPMPWMLNLYKWRLTRWLVPPIWKEASKEKLSHRQDLQNFENNWKKNPSEIISIHGNADWIVPLSNSEFLKVQFPETQFDLKIIDGAGHGFVWSHFDSIKQELLKQLN